MPDGRRPTHGTITHRITRATAQTVEFHPPVPTRGGRQSQLPPEKFQVTDPALGLKPGNEFQKSQSGHPGYEIIRFGRDAGELAGRMPSVDDNPYNFVAFAESQPWTASPPHPDHARWQEGAFSGVLEIEAEALTPVFVPMGFPFEPANTDQADQLRLIPRHFFRLKDGEGKLRYAIPGSSLKGVLRAGVEALTNSLCGEVNIADYEKPIPYRRRVFQAGRLTTPGDQGWEVEPIEVRTRPPSGSGWQWAPYRRNLLAQKAATGPKDLWWRPADGQPLLLPQNVIKTYLANLDHPHYRNHFDDPKRAKPPYDGGSYPASWEGAKKHLASLQQGTIIYYTEQNGKITTFGKNVNYLWPAKKSVRDLAGQFFPPSDGRRGLGQKLSLAERIFGFSGRHDRNRSSHPFQGKIRCTPLWSEVEADSFEQEAEWPEASTLTAPPSTKGMKLLLAPLTSPETRAKARPLYLVSQRSTGQSASYDDLDVELMGRKFYWHQTTKHPSGIAPHHFFDPVFHKAIARQCPPPLYALRAETRFTGRIYFDNLTGEELGALLYAIEGDGRYDHAIKIGKGKPRGLGSMRLRVTGITVLDPRKRYCSLVEASAPVKLEGRQAWEFKRERLKAFEVWALQKAGRTQGSLSNLPHIQDYDALHNWSCAAPRYYPINFSAYSWLPKDNDAAGEPRSGKRPPAMQRARQKPGCPKGC
jgi:hypothetical protein